MTGFSSRAKKELIFIKLTILLDDDIKHVDKTGHDRIGNPAQGV